ncbi:hypothetical protein EDD16DRAFT_1057755 [Pisolithus croceorrhizus]|nr:hypothetical protein EDD16DRAFT_1057755 [Pisolithus croceorrhizus]KAI6160144.1 hypothetical protein EDD17DRAFT_1605360 [Pisolithus thermaeus]
MRYAALYKLVFANPCMGTFRRGTQLLWCTGGRASRSISTKTEKVWLWSYHYRTLSTMRYHDKTCWLEWSTISGGRYTVLTYRCRLSPRAWYFPKLRTGSIKRAYRPSPNISISQWTGRPERTNLAAKRGSASHTDPPSNNGDSSEKQRQALGQVTTRKGTCDTLCLLPCIRDMTPVDGQLPLSLHKCEERYRHLRTSGAPRSLGANIQISICNSAMETALSVALR